MCIRHGTLSTEDILARTDLYYPDQRLALEYDGGSHRESLVEDNRRQNRLLRRASGCSA